MQKNKVITVQNLPISISKEDIDDYICITDIAAAKSDESRAADVVRNWLRNRRTLEFLSTWKEIYNPNFKVFESENSQCADDSGREVKRRKISDSERNRRLSDEDIISYG